MGGPTARSAAYARMSAIHMMDRASAAFSIHPGTFDEQVPYPWSETIRDAVAAAGLRLQHFA